MQYKFYGHSDDRKLGGGQFVYIKQCNNTCSSLFHSFDFVVIKISKFSTTMSSGGKVEKRERVNLIVA